MSGRGWKLVNLVRKKSNLKAVFNESNGNEDDHDDHMEALDDLGNMDDSDADPDYVDETDYRPSDSDEDEEHAPSKKIRLPSHLYRRKISTQGKTLNSLNIIESASTSSRVCEIDNTPACNSSVALSSNSNSSVIVGGDAINVNESGEIPMTKRGQPRKRGMKGDTRKSREERKYALNRGLEYETCSGKKVVARKMEQLSACRNKCKEKLTAENHKKLFEEYWSIGNFNRRLDFIASLIETRDKSRVRGTNATSEKFRQITVDYHVNVDGDNLKLCKSCFMKVFGEKNRFIETVIQKKRFSFSGIIQLDKRGSAEPKNKLSDAVIDGIKEFLALIPAYESHYSRRDCDNKFIPSHYTLVQLYEEFKIKNPDVKVSRCIFEREFHNMNLCIKKPKVDTCATCDKLNLKIKLGGDETHRWVEELKGHQILSDSAYESKRRDKLITKFDDTMITVTFDLQQCLPTPLVNSSVAFYLRQLWTFNLTVHDCDSGQPKCFLWHEGIAGRGANEIGSCLYDYMMNLKSEVKHLIMYSDTCAGQNKNSHVAVMCLVALQNSPNLKKVDHKFLLSGHTHMECDSDHSLIEKKKKRFNGNIEHPHDWAQLIRQTGKKNPFMVKEMQREDFFDFAALLKTELQLRKVDDEGRPFNWHQVKWLHYEKDQLGFIFYKKSLNEDEPFCRLNLKRRGRQGVLKPQLRYKTPNKISVEKKRDLLSLLQFINPVFHQFYEDLETSESVRNVLPDVDNEESE